MVLMVNERQLKGLAAPKTWADLMKPEWKGKVVLTVVPQGKKDMMVTGGTE